eukprot:gb/GECH01001906.1/.p1 GENE.gb/GECH01001906.1/~~gb/GECH01001906.1/.p1  ORF type:complete len:809 (+),score=191.80 gb/GECH01001906.1/:1-2427(+)
MNSELRFLSIGCNRVANCAAWGINELYAFAAGSFVGLYDQKKQNVVKTLKGHTKRVNSVCWIPNLRQGFNERWFTPENELVSGSVDKNIIVWKKDSESQEWIKSDTLKGHTNSVTNLATLALESGETLIASASADSTVRLWRRESSSQSSWEQIQTIDFGTRPVETLAFTCLPNSQIPCLAAGGLDRKVHIFARKGKEFESVVRLEGHQDWIRDLAFTTCDDGSVLLASASQDVRVRLWKFGIRGDTGKGESSALLKNTSLLMADSDGSMSLSQKGHIINVDDDQWRVELEALLTGHEEWVYSVSWHPPIRNGSDGKYHQPMKLLTASMDRTMMIWEPFEEEGGIWISEVTVGEFGGLSGLFGQLGFFGASFSNDGQQILAHSYNGSFHCWKKDENEEWKPQVTSAGHTDSVQDLDWDPEGGYLVSTSFDQTTRLFAPWKDSPHKGWYEIARPQIHGYDLTCLALLRGRKHAFASGADEKVLRVFEAPESFLETLFNISGILCEDAGERPLGAVVPELGLSNKPIMDGDDDPAQSTDLRFDPAMNEDTKFTPITLHQPPFEEHLLQNTLWPETQKLYGHANQLICSASSHDGRFLASGCKAKEVETADIIIWSTQEWIEVLRLKGHTLTVTQLEFSVNDRYLLSVSRDRNICIFKRSEMESGKITYELNHRFNGHDRIIWGCSWCPNDRYFVTGSRDKTAKIWSMDNPEQSIQTLKFKQPVTAVQFGPIINSKYTLAIGLENGEISIWTASTDHSELSFSHVHDIAHNDSHMSTVRRLRWQHNTENQELLLASCSTDHSVRLFVITGY